MTRRPNSFRDFVSPTRGVLRRYALGRIIAVRVLIVPMIAKGLFFPQMFETCKRKSKKKREEEAVLSLSSRWLYHLFL